MLQGVAPCESIVLVRIENISEMPDGANSSLLRSGWSAIRKFRRSKRVRTRMFRIAGRPDRKVIRAGLIGSPSKLIEQQIRVERLIQKFESRVLNVPAG